MNNNKQHIEIEPIMDQIRQQIKSKKRKNHEPCPLPDSSRGPGKGVQAMTLDELRNKLNESWNVSQRPFTSYRPIIGPLIVLYKKILLKLVKMPLCNYL
ncbi:MAG: hypothetical protein QME64_11925, partial [bacterium]|nr:hypothetical protein [bacterium]